jgi:hypothetical protein
MSAIGRSDAKPATAAVSDRQENFFLLVILALPVAASPLMQAHIVDLPGMKLFNLICAAFALTLLSGFPRVFPASGRLERNALLAFAAFIAVFVISVLRAIPHIRKFHEMAPDSMAAGTAEFLQSELIVPLILAATFIYVLKRSTTAENTWRLLRAIGAAIFILSCVVVFAIVSKPDVYSDPRRFAMANLMTAVLGMHYNGIGTFYIIAGPILLYLALKRGSFWTANYFLALLAVTMLESRTALFIFVGMSAATLVALDRARTLVAMAPPVIIVAVIAAGPLLIQLFTMGFTAHSGLSWDAFLSGRDDRIWLPLIAEWWSDPQRFWFGAGEHGILTSFLLFSGVVLEAGHSHNAFLDYFLDNGIVLGGALIVAVIAFIVWGWRAGRRLRNPLYWTLYLSVFSFLLAAITGRRFHPEIENAMLFPIVALMIDLVRNGAPGPSRVSGNPRAEQPLPLASEEG